MCVAVGFKIGQVVIPKSIVLWNLSLPSSPQRGDKIIMFQISAGVYRRMRHLMPFHCYTSAIDLV
jgi:hypothetical protein